MGVCHLYLLCRYRSLQWADLSSRGVLPSVCVCVCVCVSETQMQQKPSTLIMGGKNMTDEQRKEERSLLYSNTESDYCDSLAIQLICE